MTTSNRDDRVYPGRATPVLPAMPGWRPSRR